MDEHQTNPMCLDGQSCFSGAHIMEGYKANLIRESHRWGGWLNHVHFRNNMGVLLKMLYTPKPNGFADHYPVLKWLFHWEYTLFSDKPISNTQAPCVLLILAHAGNVCMRVDVCSLMRYSHRFIDHTHKSCSHINVPSGKHTKNYRKSPLFMGKLTINGDFP